MISRDQPNCYWSESNWHYKEITKDNRKKRKTRWEIKRKCSTWDKVTTTRLCLTIEKINVATMNIQYPGVRGVPLPVPIPNEVIELIETNETNRQLQELQGLFGSDKRPARISYFESRTTSKSIHGQNYSQWLSVLVKGSLGNFPKTSWAIMGLQACYLR